MTSGKPKQHKVFRVASPLVGVRDEAGPAAGAAGRVLICPKKWGGATPLQRHNPLFHRAFRPNTPCPARKSRTRPVQATLDCSTPRFALVISAARAKSRHGAGEERWGVAPERANSHLARACSAGG